MKKEEFNAKHLEKFAGVGIRKLQFDKNRNLFFVSNYGKQVVAEYGIIVDGKFIFNKNGVMDTNVDMYNCESWEICINNENQIMSTFFDEKLLICKNKHVCEDEVIIVYYRISSGVELYFCDGNKMRAVCNLIAKSENSDIILTLGRVLCEMYRTVPEFSKKKLIECKSGSSELAETEKMQKMIAEYEKNQLQAKELHEKIRLDEVE